MGGMKAQSDGAMKVPSKMICENDYGKFYGAYSVTVGRTIHKDLCEMRDI